MPRRVVRLAVEREVDGERGLRRLVAVARAAEVLEERLEARHRVVARRLLRHAALSVDHEIPVGDLDRVLGDSVVVEVLVVDDVVGVTQQHPQRLHGVQEAQVDDEIGLGDHRGAVVGARQRDQRVVDHLGLLDQAHVLRLGHQRIGLAAGERDVVAEELHRRDRRRGVRVEGGLGHRLGRGRQLVLGRTGHR